jgi:uncharacterized LabA/DUF88 family protein
MRARIKPVYALIDWHNIGDYIAPGHNNVINENPRREIPKVLFKLQQQVADVLGTRDPGEKHRVTMRIYHGWHREREPMPIRRDFEQFSMDSSLARNFAKVSFGAGFQFGNELVCGTFRNPLYATVQRSGQGKGQKMVDTALACDALHILQSGLAEICVLVTDDDDFVPVSFTAEKWGRKAILLRRPGSDIRHVTDTDCSAVVAYWR